MNDVAEVALTDDEFKSLAEYASACDLAIGEAAHHLIVDALPAQAVAANGLEPPTHILPIKPVRQAS